MANIKYNSERLNAVIRDFCIMTNVSVSVVDPEFITLAAYSEKTPGFCREIQKSQKGHEKCLCSDLSLIKKCAESRRIVSHICHAGIMDAAIPIIKSDKLIGYILIGRIRVAEFDEKRIDWMSADKKKMRELYYDITEYNERQVKSMFELASMIVSFILTNDIIKTETDEFSERVSEYIDEHLKDNLSVERLCKKFSVSKNYLYNKFKTSFSMTVNEYIASKRVSKGRELLLNTDYSISRISEEIGIGNYTYFSRLFKERYNIPPLAYRKSNEKIFEKSIDKQ